MSQTTPHSNLINGDELPTELNNNTLSDDNRINVTDARSGDGVTVTKQRSIWTLRKGTLIVSVIMVLFSVFLWIYGITALGVNWNYFIPGFLSGNGISLYDHIPGNTPINLCMVDEHHLFKFKHAEISPEEPQGGSNITITANGYLEKEVTDGAYLDVVVNWGFIQLLNKRYDLCEVLPNAGIECPAAIGDYSVNKTVEIPQGAPPGIYSLEARAFNKDDELLSCVTGDIELKSAI